MSLPKRPQPSQFSVDNLMGDAFAPADPYRLFLERLHPVLLQARPQLELCYCRSNGRPAREPVLMLGITLLQFIEKLPDRQAMHMLKYHLGWKLALQQELGVEELDPSLLVYFRQRLMESAQGKLLFDSVLQALIQTGLVPRGGKRRLDSTSVLGLLADLSEAEKLYETMRLAVVHLQGAKLTLPTWFEGLVDRYVRSRPDWRMTKPQAKAYCQKLGQDLQLLWQWVHAEQSEQLAHRPLVLLDRVYEESFALKEEALEHANPGPGSLCNPHEPDAVVGRKGKDRWVGFKVQISESVPQHKAQAGEPTGGFITAVHTQVASEGDIKSLPAVREAEKLAGLETPEQRYVDSAYLSGVQLRQEQQAGGELMGPLGGSSAEHPAIKQGFVIEPNGQHAICPAGHANEFCRVCQKKPRHTQFYRLVWKKCCKECPLRQGCLGRHSQRQVEAVADYALLSERRERQKSDEFREQMHQRNGIEGTISELVRGYGMRRTRYRSLPKVSLCNLLIAAACNARRWLRRLQWQLQPACAVS